MTSSEQFDGQRAIIRALRDLSKLRLPEDLPDAPTLIRDRTPLRKGQISTLDLRGEFRRDAGLPILIGDAVFTKGIRDGVTRSEYIYQYRDLLLGPGDPPASIAISEDAFVFTMTYAKEHGIWPPVPPAPVTPTFPPNSGGIAPGSITTFGGSAPSTPDSGEGGGESKLGGLPGVLAAGSFKHEGPLREALKVVLLEKAKSGGASRIGSLNIRLT